MNGTGQNFLSRAAFTDDENGDIGFGGPSGRRQRLEKSSIRSDKCVKCIVGFWAGKASSAPGTGRSLPLPDCFLPSCCVDMTLAHPACL